MKTSTFQRKPRIACMTYAIDHRPAKGTALVARKSIEALIEQKDVYDITLLHYEAVDDPLYQHGVREVVFPRFRWSIFNRRSIRQLWYFLTTSDYFDCIQWFQPRLYPFFWLAPARYKIATLHGAGDITAPHAPSLTRSMFNWSLRIWKRHLTWSIAVSEYAKQEIHEAYGIPSERIVVIPNGVESSFHHVSDPAIRERVRERYGLPSRYVLSVARFMRHKNIPRLIQAFSMYLERTHDAHMMLVLVGMDGDDLVQVQSAVGRYGVEAHVKRIVYVEDADLPTIYSLAVALVFPSLNEGFGLPVIESMACETPVVTSTTTSLPEIAGEAALLVPPDDPLEIAVAIERVQDAAIRENLIRKGTARARLFTWERHAASLCAFYQKIFMSTYGK